MESGIYFGAKLEAFAIRSKLNCLEAMNLFGVELLEAAKCQLVQHLNWFFVYNSEFFIL